MAFRSHSFAIVGGVVLVAAVAGCSGTAVDRNPTTTAVATALRAAEETFIVQRADELAAMEAAAGLV